MFANVLSRYWWLTLIRGLLWVAFGILVFAQPGISLLALTALFAAFVLVDGIVNVVNAISGRKEQEHWWLLLLVGLAGIVVGMLAALNPALSALALLFYVAVWAVTTGVLEIVAAVRLRREIRGELWLILAGLISVAFGVFLLARPEAGILAVLWIVGAYGIVFGATLIVLSLKARGFVRQLSSVSA
jgi:uncharacterized membrane protein HdeD (DUF308 family)